MTTSATGASPAEALSTPVDGVAVLGSLSPSRAGDFLACPLLYRFRAVDRLPEPSSPEAVRGTVVHKVLEDLFDLNAESRTPARARELLRPAWEAVLGADPGLAEVVSGVDSGVTLGADAEPDAEPDAALARLLDRCAAALDTYFTLEDPRRLEPTERELYVEAVLGSRLLLRGFVDRVDVSPDGLVRIVDYKTGRAPSELFEAKALFQLKFYALVLWRMRGVVPAMLQLIYLGNGEVLRYAPDEQDLLACERKVEAIWTAIREAEATGDWRPRPSRLCDWCAHQSICPAYGGTPPPLPNPASRTTGATPTPATPAPDLPA